MPNIDGVRLATFADLERIAVVAAAAFFWSPTFRFQRPWYRKYPEDTIASYLADYTAALKDPACAVLVAEDDLETDEAGHVYEALRSAFPCPTFRQKGIVGVCSLSLKPGSSYLGCFQPTSKHVSSAGRCQATTKLPKRDQSDEAIKMYGSVTGPVKLRHFVDKMRLSTLAVAPAYWRRGHATRLVNFCTQVADSDKAQVGISATPRGMIVAAKAGFEECEVIRIAHLELHNKVAREDPPEVADVMLWIGVRLPSGRSPRSDSASGTDSDLQ
ncbi:hypothetical protein FB567DRAFT_438097 [Paraphoma chrysanthemicola]|uniref:N-acetyltransferase domain-containing protein n=1 Tax=Paraphoma chrysanthemicola TaxID=798071 RepID=A0A8K0W1D5_9PLEO|nr:hypothetical protein FB567DRAFT_438097 [Paraphoma chrysanthemicola]